MALAALWAFPDNDRWKTAWSHDHAMAHRNVMVVMGPLTQWSAMPYYIDPQRYQARPATNWHYNHQRAHTDFNTHLPAYGTAETGGIPSAQILVDSNLQQPGSRAWWTHANHIDHLVSTSAILPLPLGSMVPQLPWWLEAPYLQTTYW